MRGEMEVTGAEKLRQQVQKTIEKYQLLEKEDKTVVGVSGGPDSLALLHILHTLHYQVVVAHVNHGLRQKAEEEETFVKAFCEERGIACFIKRVKLQEMTSHMTLEELGRKVRYDFFQEVMQKEHCTKIATAHHANDNAETVMMNLIRGTGLTRTKGYWHQTRWHHRTTSFRTDT